MGISLTKGGNISLTKEAPGLSAVVVGLGWDARTTDGTGSSRRTCMAWLPLRPDTMPNSTR